MNIAVDTTPIDPKVDSAHKVRGVGTYITQLVNGLKRFGDSNNYEFFSNNCVPANAEIVHYPYFDLFFHTVDLPHDKKIVVTLHDLTPLKFSKEFPIGLKGKFRWAMNKKLLRNVDAIITDSESSKKDIHHIIGIPVHKITVVYLAVDEHFRPKKIPESRIQELRSTYCLPEKFFLYVGDVTWNKNLPRIVKACKSTHTSLVLVGKALKETNIDRTNPWNSDLMQVQGEIGRDEMFHVLGFVPTEDLVDLYNLAIALLMPSLYEGFGLPVLEAMQSGCPVIASKEGSLPEVAGDAARYVDAYNQNDIANAITDVLNQDDQRMQMSKRGLAQAKKFSLEKMIQETISVYQSL